MVESKLWLNVNEQHACAYWLKVTELLLLCIEAPAAASERGVEDNPTVLRFYVMLLPIMLLSAVASGGLRNGALQEQSCWSLIQFRK